MKPFGHFPSQVCIRELEIIHFQLVGNNFHFIRIPYFDIDMYKELYISISQYEDWQRIEEGEIEPIFTDEEGFFDLEKMEKVIIIAIQRGISGTPEQILQQLKALNTQKLDEPSAKEKSIALQEKRIAQWVELGKTERMYFAIWESIYGNDFQVKKHQKQWFQNERNYWEWISLRMRYLSYLHFDFLQPEFDRNPLRDPCESLDTFPLQAEQVRVFSNFFFCILQLLIADSNNSVTGFSLIKQWALSKGKEFPFCDATELFVEIYRCWDKDGWQIFIEGGSTKEDLKTTLRTLKKFFKGDWEKSQRTQYLKSCEEENWSLAWLVAIYPKRFKEPLRQFWQEFDEAFSSLVQFVCRKPSEYAKLGVQLIMPSVDRHDNPINPKTKQRLEFES